MNPAANSSVCRSAISAVLVLLAILATAVRADTGYAGVVTHLSGTLSVKKADGAVRLLAAQSQVVEGDEVTTAAGSYARIKFVDGAEVVLKPDTVLGITRYQYADEKPAQDSTVISLLKGGLRAVTGLVGKRNPDKVSVVAKVATIGIRGTHFGVLDCERNSCADLRTANGDAPPDGLFVDVAQGRVEIANTAGKQEIGAGEFGYVRDASTPPSVIPPEQGIRVTMPDSISRNNTGGSSVGVERSAAACTM